MSDNFGETRPVDLESDWRRDESADVADDVDCRAVLQIRRDHLDTDGKAARRTVGRCRSP
jgi:hypothetical protein